MENRSRLRLLEEAEQIWRGRLWGRVQGQPHQAATGSCRVCVTARRQIHGNPDDDLDFFL